MRKGQVNVDNVRVQCFICPGAYLRGGSTNFQKGAWLVNIFFYFLKYLYAIQQKGEVIECWKLLNLLGS